MLVANAKERAYKKKSFVKNIRLAKMPFKYDLILNVIISLEFRYINEFSQVS
jgi:hypothetical protein